MSSKIIGAETKYFSNLAVDAVLKIKQISTKDNNESKENNKDKVTYKYPINNIHILKCHGQSARDSELVDGFALNCTRASQQMPTDLNFGNCGGKVKIACLDFNLQKHKMSMGVQVVVSDTKQVEEIRQRELDITREKIEKIISTGAKVVLTTKGIDDLCLKYFVEKGVMAVRRVRIEDMRRIAKATGSSIVVTMSDIDGNEVFDANNLGECDSVSEERVGDGELIYIRGCKSTAACTIVLRGPNEYFLDEMDRALHDSLCVIRRIVENNSLVAGGGAVETALAMHLDSVATSLGSRESLAVQQYAEALMVIPRTLTINSAFDATELVSQLRSYHHTSQSVEGKENYKYMGLDLINGKIVDNLSKGVIEPAISKIKSLRFATEAAISILRIDDMIKLNAHKDPNQR